MSLFPRPVKLPPALVGALLVAVAAHGIGSWWLMAKGWVGRSGGVVAQVDAGERDAFVLRVRLAERPSGESLLSPDQRGLAALAPADARPVSGAEASPLGGLESALQAPMPLPAPTTGGAALSARYLPTEELDQAPAPEPGWLLDESAFDGIARARLVLRLWVSQRGRIDRAELVRAEPAGAWAEQAIRPLPSTRMLPGWIKGQPVASVIVVEIAADDEGFR